MKLKLVEVLKLNSLLKAIIDNEQLKIDPLLKFKLLGVMKDIETPVNNFEIIRNDKIKEYGKEVEDENGNKNIAISVDDEQSINKFKEDIDKITQSEIQVNIQKIKASEIFDKGLPSDYMIGLYPIIEE